MKCLAFYHDADMSNDKTLEKLTKQPGPHSSEFIPDKKIIKLPFEKNELVMSPINDTVSIKSESSKSSRSVTVETIGGRNYFTNQSILTKNASIPLSIGITLIFADLLLQDI